MLNIKKLREVHPRILVIGTHPAIIQSILDFDYLSGKEKPSVVGIIGTGKKFERYFFGDQEMLLPLYRDYESAPTSIKKQVNFFISNASGRRTFSSTESLFPHFPNLLGGAVFAENVPEKFAVMLSDKAHKLNKFIIGPASVGMIIPNHLKLGAIGGTQAKQLIDSNLFTSGNVAVFAASGGMTNEIISVLSQYKKHISFAVSFGGDRFPIVSPKEAFIAAENDPETKYIVYYGELGGYDEYEVAELLITNKITKKTIVYIAGSISEMFEKPPQFGHAKAMAEKGRESAQEKRKVLQKAGADVANTYNDFVDLIKKIAPENRTVNNDLRIKFEKINSRRSSLFVSRISGEKNQDVQLLGEDQLAFTQKNSYAAIVISMLLGRKIKSKRLEMFVDLILKLMVDNGPYQSGVTNTMVTARAGKDMVSSVVAGLLTIGPRFGGAVNEAATNWFSAVRNTTEPYIFVENFAKRRKFILGIGHRKYRSDFPDPRVSEILAFTSSLKDKKFSTFALNVEKITVAKKGNLILNVDGALAAVLLDLLYEEENLRLEEIEELIEAEFFNALFIISRTVGFTAHFLDQKRLDEGLFRLSSDQVKTINHAE